MKFFTTTILAMCLSSAYASDKHYEAAIKHVQLTEQITSMEEMAEGMVNGLLMSKPQFRPFKKEFTAFFIKMLTSEEYKKGQAQIYQQTFTLEELQYANRAFSDPRLASYLRKTPIVVERSMLLGNELASKHKDELNTALETRVKEIETLSRESSTQ